QKKQIKHACQPTFSKVGHAVKKNLRKPDKSSSIGAILCYVFVEKMSPSSCGGERFAGVRFSVFRAFVSSKKKRCRS
ncbi:MAG: hypothetical protein D6714_13240, partial [Bacteroidetes bacterium]